MVRCALVCITKNDERYLREFIDYYQKLGFDTIFLYDNSDRIVLKRWNKPPRIRIIPFPGKNKQNIAYNHFLKAYKKKFDYVAFFDTDEFLVLKKHRTIQEFCLDMIPSGAIGINWYMFGNNGYETYSEDLVLNRFTKREKEMNPHIKTIGKCSDILEMMIHNPSQGTITNNCRWEIIDFAFNSNVDDSIAQLNHYYTKSTQEFKEKIERGKADDFLTKRIWEQEENNLYVNSVEDLWAYRFFHSIPLPDSVVLVSKVSSQSELDHIQNNYISYFSKIYIYILSDTPLEKKNEEKIILLPFSVGQNHAQDFLIYHKHDHSHVLFIDPQDSIPLQDDFMEFCLTHVSSGALLLSSSQFSGHRILGKCTDLLEVKDNEVLKLGFKTTISYYSL